MSRLGDLYERHLLPRIIDLTCSDRVTGPWREQVCAPVGGEVLEVGFGSGTNLAHYPAGVSRVLAVEPSDLAWRRAGDAIAGFGRPVDRIGLDGAVIDLPDASVDAVVSAFTMCTIPDLDGALAEFRRVLRPGGSLHFVEHGLSPEPAVARRQNRLQPWWGKVAGGCHLNREMPVLITAAGFTLDQHDAFSMPGPGFAKPFGWLNVGHASPG